MEQVQKKNILGTEPIGGLLRQFAVPSIIAMLVGALYNIVDQFFIGRSVGELGNAATNVAFPLTISCVALALLFGIGGAASFNLTLGGGEREKALFYIGNAATLLFGSGVILGAVALLCLTPMLRFFGSPDNVLAYAKTYTGITALGFPFLILTNGGGHLVRADGSPRNAMLYNLSRKCFTTHTIPINCEITVAVAAPRIPQSKWKIKIGARMMLQTTVTMEVNIAFLGYPVARMILFSPIIV